MGCLMFFGGLVLVVGGLANDSGVFVVLGAVFGLMAFGDPSFLPAPRDWSLPVETKYLGHHVEGGCDVYTVQAANLREVSRFTDGTSAPGGRTITKVDRYRYEIRNNRPRTRGMY